ncbi:uncharacterized protein ACBT44_021102 isoform 7-T10 [Syngnathus typhle]
MNWGRGVLKGSCHIQVRHAGGFSGFKESYQMQAPPTAWRFLGIQGELSNTGATDRVAVSRKRVGPMRQWTRTSPPRGQRDTDRTPRLTGA